MSSNNKLIFKAFNVFIVTNSIPTSTFYQHLLIFLFLGWPHEMASTSIIFAYPGHMGRSYFADLKVTKRNTATVLLTLTLFQTPTLTLTIILT
jgi:hypothetical protein